MKHDPPLARRHKLPASGCLDLDVVNAHDHCSCHREDLLRSSVCACFWCLSDLYIEEIVEWIDGGDTAVCPKCGIDAVIGSASGYPVEQWSLKRMHDYWIRPGDSNAGNLLACTHEPTRSRRERQRLSRRETPE